ncbi:MAG: (d)CMP kinase [Henriciella sp.]|uniref:(d)CMP kinase n=1 Tax=Henriciella sp. TaxID=1968823 RepID=UPI003C742BF0
MIIAIDGTLASGKGTIARRIAAWYGLPYLDTGRLYRATGVAAIRAGVNLEDGDLVAAVAASLDLNDFEEEDLRSAEAGVAASKVAVLPEVRAALLDLQRAFANQAAGAVLDGRDIGTVICPNADAKLWIDADLEVRAQRRHKELTASGDTITLEDLTQQLRERDARDASRKDAPMKKAADAALIDTTHLTIDAAVDKARSEIDMILARKD